MIQLYRVHCENYNDNKLYISFLFNIENALRLDKPQTSRLFESIKLKTGFKGPNENSVKNHPTTQCTYYPLKKHRSYTRAQAYSLWWLGHLKQYFLFVKCSHLFNKYIEFVSLRRRRRRCILWNWIPLVSVLHAVFLYGPVAKPAYNLNWKHLKKLFFYYYLE